MTSLDVVYLGRAVVILKRGGRVYTKIILDSCRTTLIPIIAAKVEPNSVVFSDSFPACDVLDISGFRHHRINHQKAFVVAPRSHINGIENFWSQAKRHPRCYNGIPRHHFHLFLKECEWRFSYGSPNQLLKTLRRWIKLSIS